MFGPTRTSLATSATAALATLTTLVAGCSGSNEATGAPVDDETNRATGAAKQTVTAKAPKPPPPPPEQGECRDLVFSDIGLFSNEGKKVSCGDGHTAYTFAVETLPGKIAFEGVDIENKAVQSGAAESCSTAFAKFIGGDASTRALARLTVTYFLPKQQEFDLGAHWVRCDAVALQTAQTLASLPLELEGVLEDDSALQKWGVCSTGEPGAESSGLVMCTRRHTFRALAALELGDSDTPYPGADSAEKIGQQCEALVSDALGVEGDFTYGWTYPSASDWADGQRFGYCWNQTAD